MLRRKIVLLDEEDNWSDFATPIIVTTGWHAPMFQIYAVNQTFQIGNETKTFQINNTSQSFELEN